MTTNITMLARNRLRLTYQALESLWNTPNQAWNLTVLDDRSDEPTANLLRGYGALRNNIPMGTGPLRNLVIKESEKRHGRGDYLYISDNDVMFNFRDWLNILIQCYDAVWARDFRVLGAVNHPFHQPTMTISFAGGMKVNEVNALASQSMLLRWDVWDEYGPFCDTPVDRVCQSEDVDFTNKIRKAGFKLGVVSPALIVSTGITNTFGEHIPGWELVKRQCPIGVVCE
jgi:hypothetical protein